jgi:hypothetical protein
MKTVKKFFNIEHCQEYNTFCEDINFSSILPLMNLTEYIRCIKSTDTLLKLNNIEGIRPETAEAISYALN